MTHKLKLFTIFDVLFRSKLLPILINFLITEPIK